MIRFTVVCLPAIERFEYRQKRVDAGHRVGLTCETVPLDDEMRVRDRPGTGAERVLRRFRTNVGHRQ